MRILLLIGLIVLSSSVEAKSQKVSLNDLIKRFNIVVFVHEHGKSGKEEKLLSKWTGPVRFSPAGNLTQEQNKKFFALMNRIQRLTKLDMRFPKKGERANLVINFVPQKELKKKMAPGVNCYGVVGADARNRIVRARAFIPSDRPDKTDHCLVEETVQLFGLVNDSPLMKNSIFNDQSKRMDLSVADQILLKALYDPRLQAGMSRAEAQPVLRQVMKDIFEKIKKRKK